MIAQQHRHLLSALSHAFDKGREVLVVLIVQPQPVFDEGRIDLLRMDRDDPLAFAERLAQQASFFGFTGHGIERKAHGLYRAGGATSCRIGRGSRHFNRRLRCRLRLGRRCSAGRKSASTQRLQFVFPASCHDLKPFLLS
ncbi:hypothetical protein D3C80_517820 [compost metagenome]